MCYSYRSFKVKLLLQIVQVVMLVINRSACTWTAETGFQATSLKKQYNKNKDICKWANTQSD